jgi:tetratricopeptide (TPR) repeat protein
MKLELQTWQDSLQQFVVELQPYLEPLQEWAFSADPLLLIGIVVGLIVLGALLRLTSGRIRPTAAGLSRKERRAIGKEARWLARHGRYAEAGEKYELIEEFARAEELYRSGAASRQLGKLYERQKRWEEAAKAFEAAGDLDRAAVMYQKVGQASKAAAMLQAANKPLMAAELYEKGQMYREAARLYEQAGSLFKAASCYEQGQELQKAAELYERNYLEERAHAADALVNTSPGIRTRLQEAALQSGRLFLKLGDSERASRILTMAGLKNEAADAYYSAKQFEKAAELYRDMKQYSKAAEAYRQIGDQKRAAHVLGELLLEKNQLDDAARQFEAAEDYGQAAELYERNGKMRQAGAMYLKAGEYPRAAEMLEADGDLHGAAVALEKGKQYKQAAQLYLKIEKFEEAARLYEESESYYEAGMLFHKLGHMEETIAFLQKVPPTSAHYYDASLVLARLFMERGMLETAKERYKKLIALKEIGPGNLEPYYNLAIIYEKGREYKHALALFEKILSEDVSYRDVKEQVQKVKTQMTARPAAGAASTATGRYQLLQKVGQGGMGVVYRAKDTVLDRIVAYKVLPPAFKDNPKMLENFLQEARVAAAMNHPNIVTIYDTGAEGVDPYIVMEYVDGITLKELLEKTSPIPLPTLLNAAKQICRGLDYAHSKNVIHRDIKPANIMVSSENVVKIMDFGLAKFVKETGGDRTGVKGTPLYMAPEQIMGERVDNRTDVYALGCTLYRMAVGRPPFSEGDVYYHHVHTAPTPPRQLNPNLPEGLNRAILKCIQKKGEQRYQRVKDLLVELEALR